MPEVQSFYLKEFQQSYAYFVSHPIEAARKSREMEVDEEATIEDDQGDSLKEWEVDAEEEQHRAEEEVVCET